MNRVCKLCSVCGVLKSFDEFYRDTKNESGISSRCKKCAVAYSKEYRERNPDKAREASLIYYRRHPERVKETQARSKRKQSYGITQTQFIELGKLQKGLCAVCQKEMRQACIDHDHKTGTVRGLLCRKCNFVLGVLELLTPEVNLSFSEYLANPPFSKCKM